MNSTAQTNQKNYSPVIIMAGGTGGHIFPALAVAKALQDLSCPVTWIGTPDSMESHLVPQHLVPIRYVNIKALRGKGLKAKLLLPLRLFKATLQAISIIRDIKPAAVLGMGGFVTGPGGIAAWLMRKPLLIHEQNAVAGMTNRYLARLSSQVFEAFPDSFGKAAKYRGKNVQCVGNPIRAEIMQLHKQNKTEFTRERTLHLLVVGGSLGALALNETVPLAIANLFADEKLAASSIEIRHQAGERTYAHATQAYRNANVQADVVKFIDDMAAAYQWADLVICRAGALTVSELSAAGVPAIFIPFPYAVDDHQRKNAEVLSAADAAIVIPQNELTPELLAITLHTLVSSPSRVNDMSQHAKAAAKLQATDVIKKLCLQYAEAAA